MNRYQPIIINRWPLWRPVKALLVVLAGFAIAAAAATLLARLRISDSGPTNPPAGYSQAPTANHQQVRATVFWVGEDAGSDNRFIDNHASAWVTDWVGAYGGIDDPAKRCGYQPCDFTPRENPFYFALPFNDYTDDGELKAESQLRRIGWYDGRPQPGRSLLKNQWIAVAYRGKTVYAQWEDVGPFGENDIDYVFGNKPPRAGIGLDLSPAAADYLDIDGEARVDWHFVEPGHVPDGPWKQTITGSGLDS